jgi:hypothetical protein
LVPRFQEVAGKEDPGIAGQANLMLVAMCSCGWKKYPDNAVAIRAKALRQVDRWPFDGPVADGRNLSDPKLPI